MIPATLRGARVLVVDDCGASRQAVAAILRDWGMRPTVVKNGREAIGAIRNSLATESPFSVALVDVRMPGTSRIELVENLRKHEYWNGATILLLPTSPRAGDLDRCLGLDAAATLAKPVRHDILLEAITKACAPSSISELSRRAATTPSTAPGAEGGLRILLAEDHPFNQRVARLILEKWGHEVTVASNGKEACDAVEGQAFDLALLDLHMPGMDGIEATGVIRAREAEVGGRVAIIAMTACAMTGDRERCLAAGMDGYVAKPIRAEALRRKIDAIHHALGNASHAAAGGLAAEAALV